MRHYIYKIINNINGHYYIGRRSFEGAILEQDSYFGSGKRLKVAIKKYGIENFSKEIISEHLNVEELVTTEKSLVTTVEVNDPSCYNMALGGHGGYTYYADRKLVHTEEAKRRISIANTGRPRPDAAARNISNGFNAHWTGKTRTEEDKHKKSIAAQKKLSEGRSILHTTTTCPHCNTTTNFGNAKRWHFDKCRNK